MNPESDSARRQHDRDLKAGNVIDSIPSYVHSPASPDDGDSFGEVEWHKYDALVPNLDELIAAGVMDDVKTKSIEFPPQPESILELATDFYDTYLYDTALDKIDVIDRYMAALIDALDLANTDQSDIEELRTLFDDVHQLAGASPESSERPLVTA